MNDSKIKAALDALDINTAADKGPNVLFILVDEMRFPTVFPEGIDNATEFVQKFMPNLYTLWDKGVKFSNYHTAASACTPARGTIITGLYSQQTWLCCTLTTDPFTQPTLPSASDSDDTSHEAPTLNPEFPTYGKLLRDTANYRTPYIGKWHVSVLDPDADGLGLEDFGFKGYVYPDPIAYNLQGAVGYQPGYPSDLDTANAAANWFQAEAAKHTQYGEDYQPDPFFMTVGFVNPHDREFFWAGTEYERYNELFEDNGTEPFVAYGADSGSGAPPVPYAENPLKNPPDYNYDVLPPNWESSKSIEDNKPPTQFMMRQMQALTWGGASDEASQDNYSLESYPHTPIFNLGNAPFSYWQRGMDSYTQVMEDVDLHIGKVLENFYALPDDVIDNTVIIFASDHGEYSGAHGFLSGKMGSVYKEAYNVPLVVVDPSGRYTAQTDVIRNQFVSSVDLLRMFVSLGNQGSSDWINGDLEDLYGDRLDILPILQSSDAPGRDKLLLVTDELIPDFLNFDKSPMHIIGSLDSLGKLGTYARWEDGTDNIITDPDKGFTTEYYDYTEQGGDLELINKPNSAVAEAKTTLLIGDLVPNELRKPMPNSDLQAVSDKAKEAYLTYLKLLQEYTLEQLIEQSVEGSSDTDSKADDRKSSGTKKKLPKLSFGRSF